MSKLFTSWSPRCGVVAAVAVGIILANGIFADGILAGETAPVGSAERGRIAFVKHGCWQCHGFEGQGSIATSNGKVIAADVLPFEAFASFVQKSNRSMPPYRETVLSNADLADIYSFLQSIPATPEYRNILLLNRHE